MYSSFVKSVFQYVPRSGSVLGTAQLGENFKIIVRNASSSGKPFRGIIMGAPGSGKGTIAKRIIKRFPAVQHVSSGDIFRAQIADKTPEGLEAKQYIDKGAYVPDDVTLKLVGAHLKKLGDVPLLLDGFPRTGAQADALQNIAPVDTVLYIDIPFEVIKVRLAGRLTHVASGRTYQIGFNTPKVEGKDDVTGEDLIVRDDDKVEAVQARFETYNRETSSVLDFYRNQNLLKAFKGKTEKIEIPDNFTNEIWPDILEHLSTYMTPTEE